MIKRQMVQIPGEQLEKLEAIERFRKDLVGYSVSKKVHLLLQERIKEIMSGTIVHPDQNKGQKWVEYVREKIPLHVVAPIAIGVVRNSQEMLGCAFTRILDYNDSSKTWWGNYQKDIQKVGEFLIGNFRDKVFYEEYMKKSAEFYSKVLNHCELIRRAKLDDYEKDVLVQTYVESYELFKRFHALSFDIDAIDIVLEEKLKQRLLLLMQRKEKEFEEAEWNKQYTILTTPYLLAQINSEHMSVLEACLNFLSDKNLVKLIVNPSNRYEDIEKYNPKASTIIDNLVSKYWWITLGWSNYKEKEKEDYVIEIKKILNHPENIRDELKRFEIRGKNIFALKKKVKLSLGNDKELNFYVDLFDNYAALHERRKELQMKSTFIMNKFLFEISQRHAKKFNDLIWCWPAEIVDLMEEGEIDIEKSRQRSESFFCIVTENNIEEYTQEKALLHKDQELVSAVDAIRDFKGTTACSGKAVGKAKVCFSASEAVMKVRDGDILVAPNTLPEFLPAMKKAAGIITDEGGVSCHAAIVARELDIPCIVGTKIATRVIEDGFNVELNANHGSVKIVDSKIDK